MQFLGTLLNRPPELEIWKDTGKLTEIGLVGSLIDTGLGKDLQLATRNGANGNFTELNDLMIQMVHPIVERLVMHIIERRLKHFEKST